MADNRLQAPKHKTLTFVQKITWNHYNVWQTIILDQNLTFKFGAEPNFQNL